MSGFFDILSRLPPELLDLIFSHLSLEDLMALSAVSLKHRLLTNQQWWKVCRQLKIPGIQHSLTEPSLFLPWKEAFTRSSQWKKGEFRKHVAGTFTQNTMPKVFLDSINDVLYYSERHILHWAQLDGATPTAKGRLFTHTSDIIDFTVFPEEGTTLAALANGAAMYWDNQGMQPIQYFWGHKPGNLVLGASLDDRKLFTGCHQGIVRCWDLDSQEHDYHPSRGSRSPNAFGTSQSMSSLHLGRRVWSLKTNGEMLVLGVHGKSPLQIHDVKTWQQIGPETSHRQSVYGIHLAENGMITTGSFDGSVSLWDLRATGNAGKPVMTLDDPGDEPIYCVQFDGGWKVISGTARFSGCRIWDVRNKGVKFIYPENQEPSSPVYSLHFDDYRLSLGLATKTEILSLCQ